MSDVVDTRESVERMSGGYRFIGGCWRSPENPALMLLRLIDRVEKAERDRDAAQKNFGKCLEAGVRLEISLTTARADALRHAVFVVDSTPTTDGRSAQAIMSRLRALIPQEPTTATNAVPEES